MDRPKRRKLLVASVGIASMSYALAACGKDQHPVSGNLPAPQPTETTPISGNLPAPPPVDAAPEPITGNTIAPADAAANVGTPGATDAGTKSDAGAKKK